MAKQAESNVLDLPVKFGGVSLDSGASCALLRECRRLLFDLDAALTGGMTLDRWRARRAELDFRIQEVVK